MTDTRTIVPDKKEEAKTKAEIAPGGPGKRGPKAPPTTHPKRKDK